jgi:oleate hydratase
MSDRPKVRPEGAINYAFMGQYCELENDVVFTVEYSVRSAMDAVYGLMNLPKTAPAIVRSDKNPSVLMHAIKTLLAG